MNSQPLAIDLFCGVGGMSLGFKQAGFRVVGAFDNEEKHVRAYKKNFPHVAANQADLRKSTGKELLDSLDLDDDVIDIVFGGPPCQGFSLGGIRSLDDERNLLIYEFARLVQEIQPRYFVMENVQGLMIGHAHQALNEFINLVRCAGYCVVDDIRVLNAANYAVPQRRKRIFVLGYRSDVTPPTYPEPTPIIKANGHKYFPTVKDAISDLPKVDSCEYLFDCDGFNGKLGKPYHYARLMRGEIRESSDTLPLRNRNGYPLTGCLRTRHTPKTAHRFYQTQPGKSEPISRYYRLSLDGLAPTIRAGTGKDHGKHTSPRPIHPEAPRCITVREAARLHSYPDWFQFDETRWHAFRQIGNSVPPRLARCVAAEIERICINDR